MRAIKSRPEGWRTRHNRAMTWQTLTTTPNTLGESPFWHPTEQQLYWVDIAARLVCRCNVFTGAVQTWGVPSEPGCVAPVHGGGLVLALRDGIYLARDWGGSLEKLAQLDYDTAHTRANDGKCDAQGRLWVGTYYEPRDQALAALYCVDGRAAGAAAVTRVLDGAQVANGLAWSPDERLLYWADTGAGAVNVWDFNASAAMPAQSLGGRRPLTQFPPKPPLWHSDQAGYLGRPDGAAVDRAGNYWVAMYEGARILQLSATGELLADIATPAQCPTMLCFGGDDLRSLYLTTARQKRPQSELQRYPDSGCVFSMRVTEPGLPVNFFKTSR